MRLALTVTLPNGRERDVVAEVPSGKRVVDLVAAVARHVGAGAAVHARSRRLDAWLDPDAPVSASGLAAGDVVTLSDRRDAKGARRGAVAELRVVGGPLSGLRFDLAEGDHLVGRVPPCDVLLDDTTVSRKHVLLRVGSSGVRISDAGSKNGTYIGGQLVTGERALGPSDVVELGTTLLSVQPVAAGERLPIEADGAVAFNRPPRMSSPFRPEVVRLAAPPGEAQRRKIPLATSLLPLVMGGVMFFVVKGPTRFMMLGFMALSPVMAVWSVLEERRGGRKQFRRRSEQFRKEVDEAVGALERLREQETLARRAAAPDAGALVARGARLLPELWERRPSDNDFLHLRVGTADQPARSTVEIESGGAEPLREEAASRLASRSVVHSVPAVLPLPDLGVVGVSGSSPRVDAMARWLMVQAATLHSPRDLLVAAAVPKASASAWSWLAWLPHVAAAEPTLGEPLVTEDGAADLAARLSSVVSARRAATKLGGSPSNAPAVLVLIDERVAPDRAAFADVLADGRAAGVSVLWMGKRTRDLPGECGGILEMSADAFELALTFPASGERVSRVVADGVPPEVASDVARALAPVRDAGGAAAGRVPASVTLLDVLGMKEPDAAGVARLWDAASYRVVATVGATATGPFEIDLDAEGPHGLIGGTTGAGKSELLQTMVMSLATRYPPERLSFLLVDYKGGAAFSGCTRLPHVVGTVTDLDPHLTARALASLDAEIKRREAIVRPFGDLAEMERRDPEQAPPRLIIVVDEFATLVKEIPGFIDGVVDIAARGRSLGLHLILATQRPAGVITDKIRVNVDLRIALRFSDTADSMDVVGIPDAASIPRSVPGRAFRRSGGATVEFQAAFAGGVSAPSEPEQIVVRDLSFSAATDAAAVARPAGPTDLDRLADAIVHAAESSGRARPPSPWLPALPSAISLEELLARAPDADGRLVVAGLLDEPERQRQRPYVIDLETAGSVVVYGAGGAGKTTFLRTVAASLSSRAAPSEVAIYGIDYATRGLSLLTPLPNVGDVTGADDEDRVLRLLAMLGTEVARRKQILAERRVATLGEYRAAGGLDLARIVVLLDGYAAFAASFEQHPTDVLASLPRIVADGRPLGVHVFATAERRFAVGGALHGIVSERVVLKLATEEEYAAAGLDPRIAGGASQPPGRAFVGDGLEAQIAVAGGSPSREADAIAELGRRLRAEHPGRQAPAIAVLPAVVRRDELPPAPHPASAVIGLDDADVAPVVVDLDDGHFLVAGPHRSGRTTALATLALSLRSSSPDLDMFVLSPRRGTLADLGVWTDAARGRACDALAQKLGDRLADAGDDDRFVVVIDDAEELIDGMSAGPLDAIVRAGRDLDVRVVAAGERQTIARAFMGWLSEMRKDQHGLLLVPEPMVDGDILAVRLPRAGGRPFLPGRGYLVRRGNLTLVQIGS